MLHRTRGGDGTALRRRECDCRLVRTLAPSLTRAGVFRVSRKNPVKNIDLGLAGRPFRRRTAAPKYPRCTIQQLLLPVVDLVRMDRELARQLGVRSPLIAASATFALNPALCFFRVPFISCSCAIGAF